MEPNITFNVSDEELLEIADRNIERLYTEREEFQRTSPYNRRTTYENEDVAGDYENRIASAERARQALFERMSVKRPKEIWYKSSWFITIASALIGAVAWLLQ